MPEMRNIAIFGSEYTQGHEDVYRTIENGYEFDKCDYAYPWILREFCSGVTTRTSWYNSTEGVLRDFFGFIKGFGKFNDPSVEREMPKWTFVVELPNPFNRRLYIKEYDTEVNVCGDTGKTYILDDEIRDNPPRFFQDLLDRELEKLATWKSMEHPHEVYNNQAKAATLVTSFLQAYGSDGCLVCFDQTHTPGGDVIRSVYEPYMATGGHWFAPIMSEVTRHDVGTQTDVDGKCYLTKEGHALYARRLTKYMLRRNLIARRK
jgi:hypothetical protein